MNKKKLSFLGSLKTKKDNLHPSGDLMTFMEMHQEYRKAINLPFFEEENEILQSFHFQVVPFIFKSARKFSNAKNNDDYKVMLALYSLCINLVLPKKPTGLGSKSNNKNLANMDSNSYQDSLIGDLKKAETLLAKLINNLNKESTSWLHPWTGKFLEMSYDHIKDVNFILKFQIFENSKLTKKARQNVKQIISIVHPFTVNDILDDLFDMLNKVYNLSHADKRRIYKVINLAINQSERRTP